MNSTLPRGHRPGLAPCPFLPSVDGPEPAATMRRFGKNERGPAFYGQALCCAQSLWLQGLPAQSLLLLNRALGADLRGDEAILTDWPLPYRAVAWVMRSRRSDQFIGNPRRHYQHLATRMVPPRQEQRAARAWACWLLARRVFPHDPADEIQLAAEGLVEPDRARIAAALQRHGLSGEPAVWEGALALSTGGGERPD